MANQIKIFPFKIKRQAKNVFLSDVEKTVSIYSNEPYQGKKKKKKTTLKSMLPIVPGTCMALFSIEK